MDDKSAGIDFDRQVFVQPQAPAPRSASHALGFVFALVGIGAVAFLAYKLIPQVSRDFMNGDNPGVAQLDKRLFAIEGRLEKLEATAHFSGAARKGQPAEANDTSVKQPPAKVMYQVVPTPHQPGRTAGNPAPATDPATAQRLSSLQQGIGQLQSDRTANHEAWQATTDRLADVAGQVGTQNVEILRSQDELNQLLSRTEMKAIPFELIRGANPMPVGPVSLILKSSNPKSQRYTLCVYVQPSCIELKDRTRFEVVQFVVSRNTIPFRVIATKIAKDEILGYLEVPRSQN